MIETTPLQWAILFVFMVGAGSALVTLVSTYFGLPSWIVFPASVLLGVLINRLIG